MDSVGSGFSDPSSFVKHLARKESAFSILYLQQTFSTKLLYNSGCIIVLTGPVDYVSDGTAVVMLKNGHEILGKFTGSGCILGSCIASYCAVAAQNTVGSDGQLVHGDMFLGAVAG